MVDHLLQMRQLLPFTEYLRERFRLFAPTAKPGVSADGARVRSFVFSEIEDVRAIALDYPGTILPPKLVFLPPDEILVKIDIDSHQPVPRKEPAKPVALLGVRPCDLHGLSRLDLAMRESPADAPYVRSRRGVLIVGLACFSPCLSESFCASMETYKAETGFDILLTPGNESFWVETGSVEGERIVTESGLFEFADAEQNAALDRVRARIDENFSGRRVRLASLSRDLKNFYNSAWWESLSKRCFSCGACTAVCPTCVCFDVLDEIKPGCDVVDRCRRWDSCMLRDFAAVAGGENFRPTRTERIRHRMMRRGPYLAERFDLPSFCVGCGRCSSVCLGKISPVEAFEECQKGVASDE